MNWQFGAATLTALSVAGYLLAARRGDSAGEDRGEDLGARLKITRSSGWVSLDLVLRNRGSRDIRAEELQIRLSEIEAELQTAPVPKGVTRPIRQTIPARDSILISLVDALYDAAGRPQRRYTCRLSGTVYYRVNDQLAQMSLRPRRLSMKGMKPLALKRAEREPGPEPASKFHS